MYRGPSAIAVCTLLVLFVLTIPVRRAVFWAFWAGAAGTLVGIAVGIIGRRLSRSVWAGLIGALAGALAAFHLFDYHDGPYGQIHAVVWYGIVGGLMGAMSELAWVRERFRTN
jgi:hypothetical protein